MKVFAILLVVFTVQVKATSFAQNVSMKKNNVTLKEVLLELRAQTGYYFIYNSKDVNDNILLKLNFENTPFKEVLGSILKGTNIDYSVKNKVITLSLNKNKETVVKDEVIVKNQQQDRTITGKVIDIDDAGNLVGVSVTVKGTKRGTFTNDNGLFSLNIKSTDKILVFSYIGYVAKEVPVSALIRYDVSLSKDTKQLDEVVVAFGKTTKAELTNSVTKISAEDIAQRPISNLLSAIVGASPGVQTNAGSGQPGEGPDVRIRGFTSVTNDNNPLYVVDGAPYEGVISNIDPNDIESISLLKDASATALYGARAANGVVLITTKQGVEGNKTPINARVSTAFSTRGLPFYETLDAYQYFPIMWELLKNSNGGSATYASENLKDFVGWNPFNVSDDEIVYPDGSLNPNAQLLYPDDTGFSDQLKRIGVRTDAGVSLSGGSKGTTHFISLSYLRDQGYIIGSDFNRFSGRLRLNTNPLKWLKIGFNVSANFTTSLRTNRNSGLDGNPFYVDLTLAPIYPVYQHDPVTGAYKLDANGNKLFEPGDYKPLFTGRNVVYESLYNDVTQKRNSFTAANTMEAKISKTIKFTSNFSAYINNFRGEEYHNSTMGDAATIGRNVRSNSTQYYLNWSKIFTWNKRYDKHKFALLAGHENYYNYWDELSARAFGETIIGQAVIDNFSSTRGNGYHRLYTTQGYLSKFDYSYDSKYVFSASFRRDGTSRFSDSNKWGNFWSVSGAYNIDREAFFNVKWINELKLRASYGKVGNDKTGNFFTSRMLYTLGNDNGNEGGALLTQAGNTNLQWETNSNADVAVEFSTFKNRFSGAVELFRRQSNNLLFDVRLPVTSGLLTMDENFGAMRNQGIEITLNGTPIRTKHFTWMLDGNVTTLNNKILELPATYAGVRTGTKRYDVGKSRYEFYIRDWAMINPNTGGNLYYPTEDPENPVPLSSQVFVDGVMYSSSADYSKWKYFGSAIPDYYGSVGTTLTYKDFSFRLQGIFQIGGYTYDSDYQRLMIRGTAGRAMHVDQLKAWRKPGDITDVARLYIGTSSYNSSKYITPADYFNLRMASLTYNLPKRFLSRIKISSARAFVNGENLLITSKRKGMDPTQTFTGVASYHYAPSRIISLGLNLVL